MSEQEGGGLGLDNKWAIIGLMGLFVVVSKTAPAVISGKVLGATQVTLASASIACLILVVKIQQKELRDDE